jgi:hypothetical protein
MRTPDYEAIGAKVGKVVFEKNIKYGDSFHKCGDFFRIIYPNGIRPEQYDDMLYLARDFDKSMRIANGSQGEENPVMDKIGYGILMLGKEKCEFISYVSDNHE